MTDWAAIPKLELHLHIEGATPPDLARAVAAEKGVDVSRIFDAAGAYVADDFTVFLQTYDRVAQLFSTPEDYRRLTEAVLGQCAANGVIYAELFLSPTAFGYDAGRWAEFTAAIDEGADAAEAAHGIVCRLIPVAIRHHPPEQAPELVDILSRVPRGRMTGFGLAGDERMGAPADWAPAFRAAGEAGFRLTAHAGEFGGPDSVRGALDHLRVERIGHGVRAIEDPALVARLAEERVTLEVCPGSNVALRLYPNLAAHPVDALRRAGCAITISTDDPPYFHTDMGRECENLAETFGYGADEFAAIARDALSAAFCDDATKARLAARLG